MEYNNDNNMNNNMNNNMDNMNNSMGDKMNMNDSMRNTDTMTGRSAASDLNRHTVVEDLDHGLNQTSSNGLDRSMNLQNNTPATDAFSSSRNNMNQTRNTGLGNTDSLLNSQHKASNVGGLSSSNKGFNSMSQNSNTGDDSNLGSFMNQKPQASVTGSHPANIDNIDTNQNSNVEQSFGRNYASGNRQDSINAHSAASNSFNKQPQSASSTGAIGGIDSNQSNNIEPSSISSGNHRQAAATTGSHPATTGDLNQSSNIGSYADGSAAKSNMSGREAGSAISSTPSEYGSSDGGSRRSAHIGNNKDRQVGTEHSSERPVADKDAFIQSNEINQHWQNNQTPAERSKQLAEEMKSSSGERRRGSAEKMLKLGGTKEVKFD